MRKQAQAHFHFTSSLASGPQADYPGFRAISPNSSYHAWTCSPMQILKRECAGLKQLPAIAGEVWKGITVLTRIWQGTVLHIVLKPVHWKHSKLQDEERLAGIKYWNEMRWSAYLSAPLWQVVILLCCAGFGWAARWHSSRWYVSPFIHQWA